MSAGDVGPAPLRRGGRFRTTRGTNAAAIAGAGRARFRRATPPRRRGRAAAAAAPPPDAAEKSGARVGRRARTNFNARAASSVLYLSMSAIALARTSSMWRHKARATRGFLLSVLAIDLLDGRSCRVAVAAPRECVRSVPAVSSVGPLRAAVVATALRSRPRDVVATSSDGPAAVRRPRGVRLTVTTSPSPSPTTVRTQLVFNRPRIAPPSPDASLHPPP